MAVQTYTRIRLWLQDSGKLTTYKGCIIQFLNYVSSVFSNFIILCSSVIIIYSQISLLVIDYKYYMTRWHKALKSWNKYVTEPAKFLELKEEKRGKLGKPFDPTYEIQSQTITYTPSVSIYKHTLREKKLYIHIRPLLYY
jgi:hypothetical protein